MPGDPGWVKPMPTILKQGDRRHREPHLFKPKKCVLVPWNVCMLAAAFMAVAIVARSDAVRRSVVHCDDTVTCCVSDALTGTLRTTGRVVGVSKAHRSPIHRRHATKTTCLRETVGRRRISLYNPHRHRQPHQSGAKHNSRIF